MRFFLFQTGNNWQVWTDAEEEFQDPSFLESKREACLNSNYEVSEIMTVEKMVKREEMTTYITKEIRV